MLIQLKKRQKDILAALKELGGTATTRAIAEKAGLNVNGVAQTLGALWNRNFVEYTGGKFDEARWKLESLSDTEVELLRALKDLGGTATTGAVAEQANLDVADVAQVLKALLGRNYIRWLGDESGDDRWEFIRTE